MSLHQSQIISINPIPHLFPILDCAELPLILLSTITQGQLQQSFTICLKKGPDPKCTCSIPSRYCLTH